MDDASRVEDRDSSSRGARLSGAGNATPFAVRLSWIPARDLKDMTGDWAMNEEQLELAYPVFIDADGMWLAMGSVERLEISTAAVLPDSGLPVPDQFWDIGVGAMHNRELPNGWRGGGMLRVGSPSDQPFAALRNMTVVVLGFVSIPSGERDAWNLSLFYSPTGQIVFPLPGVAYAWRPSDRFQANIGIPLALSYQATDTLTLTASYRPLTDVQVLAPIAGGTLEHLRWLSDREQDVPSGRPPGGPGTHVLL